MDDISEALSSILICIMWRKIMERDKDDYTYLEWVTGIRFAVNLYCDTEVNRIAHDNTDERPRELIKRIRGIIDRHESQIPDDIVD